MGEFAVAHAARIVIHDLDHAGRRTVKAAYEVEQGRFAAAGAPLQREKTTGRDLPVCLPHGKHILTANVIDPVIHLRLQQLVVPWLPSCLY